MPRIPRAEPEMRSPMHDQPMLAGDGWTAPGRAMQQLGQGIQSLGKGLAGFLQDQDKEAERQELHEAKLAALELRNAQDADDIKARTEYTGDGRDYGEERTGVWASRAQPFMERWGSSSRPSVQRFAQSFAAETTGIVRERAMTYGSARYVEHLFSRDREAIDRGFSLMDTPEAIARYKEDPAAFEADLAKNIESANRIIADAPYRDGKQDQLRDLAGAAAAAQINSGKVPAGSVINSVRERIQKLLAPTPAAPVPATPGVTPAPVGPQSSLGGQKPAEVIARAAQGKVEATSAAVDSALRMQGLHEARDRDVIKAFLAKGGGINNIDPALIPWCAAFVNATLKQAGIEGSNSLVATSFMKWGQPVKGDGVLKGDVLVEHRGRSPGMTGGHVGVATGETRMGPRGVQFGMLSGNQGNAVAKTWVDRGKVVVRRAIDQPAVTSPTRAADTGPARVFFDGDRNLTKPEIDQLIEKHGPNIVIGGDPSNPGFKESMAYAREKGAKTHAYDAGPGESLIVGGDEAGRISVRGEADHAAIRKRGVSVTDWQGGKWLAAQREQLLAAKKEGAEPYAIDWDNVAKTKSPSEVRDLLIDQSKWAKENGIATKIAARDFSARHWQAINAGIAAGRIDRNIIAPYGFAGDGPEGEVKAAETEAQKAGVETFRMSRTAARHAAPSEGFERKPLHIPTAGGGQVAEGGGPSVESALARRLRGQLPALELRYRREVESQIAGVEADANTGAVPSEGTIARISRQVDDIGDRGLAARFANALVTGQINAEFRQQPPAVIDAALQRMLAQAARDGVQVFPKGRAVGGGEGDAPVEEGLDPVTATTRKRIEALTKLRDTMIAGLKKDPYEWATKAGVLSETPLISEATYHPLLLEKKAADREFIRQRYGEEYAQFFRPAEREYLKERFGKGGGERLIADMGGFVKSYGSAAPQALKEIEDGLGPAATIGTALINKGDAGFIKRLADGLALRQSKDWKPLKPSDDQAMTLARAEVGTGLNAMPKVVRRAIEAANLASETELFQAGYSGAERDFASHAQIWRRNFRLALGENVDESKPDKPVYGGISPMGWFSKDTVVLPPNVRQDGFDKLRQAIRIGDLVKREASVGATDPEARGGYVEQADDPEKGFGTAVRSAPYFRNGQLLSEGALQKARPVYAGDGRYWLALGDPYGPDPQWVADPTRRDGRFMLDIIQLEPLLRQRAPDLYRPY